MLQPELQSTAPLLSLNNGFGCDVSGKPRSRITFQILRVDLQPSSMDKISASHTLRDDFGSCMQSQRSGPPMRMTTCPNRDRHSSGMIVSPGLG